MTSDIRVVFKFIKIYIKNCRGLHRIGIFIMYLFTIAMNFPNGLFLLWNGMLDKYLSGDHVVLLSTK
jgi:hypothetical protein